MQINIQKRIMPPLKLTPNVCSLMRVFGLTVDDLRKPIISFDLSLQLERGKIYFITGPSGTGKSLLLREIIEAAGSEKVIDINRLPLSRTAAVIDCFKTAPKGLKALASAGLSNAKAMFLPPAILSEGQKYRYRLAKAIYSEKPLIAADEFCSQLDNVSASVLCIKLRRIADQTGRSLLLAGHSRGLLPDLLPDFVIQVHSDGELIKLSRIDQTDMYERF